MKTSVTISVPMNDVSLALYWLIMTLFCTLYLKDNQCCFFSYLVFTAEGKVGTSLQDLVLVTQTLTQNLSRLRVGNTDLDTEPVKTECC